jgi:hypothetical protein
LVHSQAHTKFRIGELNNVYGGGLYGVSDVFQSALWMVDELFELATLGIDGVNIMTAGGGGGYGLFDFSYSSTKNQWTFSEGTSLVRTGLSIPAYPGVTSGYVPVAGVRPTFYGMLMFQQATAGGGALLPVTLGNPSQANLKTYAIVMPDRSVNVVIINKDESITGTVSVTLPGSYGVGTLSWLLATPPSSGTPYPAYLVTGATDRGGGSITWAGQTFFGSPDGKLQGTLDTQAISPSSSQSLKAHCMRALGRDNRR